MQAVSGHCPYILVVDITSHLNVTDSSVEGAVPVDQPVVPVHEAILVQAHKGLLHSCDQVVIHGEGQPVPVHTAAHAPQLPKDLAAVLLHPFEHLL